MFTLSKILSAVGILCLAISCGVDTTPGGPVAEEQSVYKEAAPVSCITMNGRSYVLTIEDGPPATDTLIFASERMEAVGVIGSGLGAFPYTCNGADRLSVKAEMRGPQAMEVRWDLTVQGDGVQGTVTMFDSGNTAGEARNFSGQAIAGADAPLRTPQRQVETL